MTRRDAFGSLGGSLAVMAALTMAAKRPRPAPTSEQIARRAKYEERADWNAAVDAKKAAKRRAKEAA